MISVLDFARLALLIAVLAFSVQANERAKRIVRERRILRDARVTGASVLIPVVKSKLTNDEDVDTTFDRGGDRDSSCGK
jgi:hypothetical protein